MRSVHQESVVRRLLTPLLAALLALCLGVGVTACSGNDQTTSAGSSASATAQQGKYPVTITSYDNDGKKYTQTFKKAPQRVVVGELSTAQLMLELGLQSRIVGATTSVGAVAPKYEAQFARLNQMTNTGDYPSKEAILNLNPDMIVSWGSLFTSENAGSSEDWNKRGISTYLLENTVTNTGNRTVSRVYTDIENLGKIFGVEAKADQLISSMKKSLADTESKVSKVPQAQRPTVLTVQSVKGNQFFGRSSKDLTTDLITLAGGRSLDKTMGKQSMENLVKDNPDVILVVNRTDTSAQSKIDSMEKNPALKSVPAVKNHKFVIVNYIDFYGGTAETPAFVASFAKQLHPDQFK